MPITRGGGVLGTAGAGMGGKFGNILCCSNWVVCKVSSSDSYSYNEHSTCWNIRRARITLKWQNHRFNESPQGTEIYWNICSTFSLTRCQISKSKLPSSGNQGLCSTTVWRHASMHWHKTKSLWTLNNEVEKWWGFPDICPITPHLPTSVGPSHSILFAKGEYHVHVSGAICCGLLQTGTWALELTKRKREREGKGNIPRATWKTNKAHTQDLYHSRRHSVSS